MNLKCSHIILIVLPNIFIIKISEKIIYCFTHFFKEIYQNQLFSLYKHVYLHSVEVKFQMLVVRHKAHGPILLRSFMFLLDLSKNK